MKHETLGVKEVKQYMDETTETPNQTKSSVMPIVIGGVVILVIAGAFLYMRSGKTEQMEKTEEKEISITEEKPAGTMEKESENETEEAQTKDENEVRVIDVEAGSFYYKPNVMKVKKGETVRIVMKSVSMMHDFNIDELGVKLPIVKNGDTGTVEFVADKAGTFEYYCSVGQHRANGQVGMITVE